MKATYITMTVSTTEDSLFGSEDAPPSYDVNPLLDSIESKVKSSFPGLDIEIIEGDFDKLDTDVSDFGDIDTLAHIQQKCWETWLEKLSY